MLSCTPELLRFLLPCIALILFPVLWNPETGARITTLSISTDMPAVRVVVVSDTHKSYSRVEIPDGDIFIHCGDSELSLEELDKWAATLPHKYKIFVAGNMDSRLRETWKGHRKLRNGLYVQDEAVNIAGLVLYGSPWTPRFVGVFQLNDESEAQDVWRKVPKSVDILVTHGPPRGILDATSVGKRVGDPVLKMKVKDIRPRLHCFGHVHDAYGTERVNGTLYCNAAIFNGEKPIVVDVPQRKKEPARLIEL